MEGLIVFRCACQPSAGHGTERHRVTKDTAKEIHQSGHEMYPVVHGAVHSLFAVSLEAGYFVPGWAGRKAGGRTGKGFGNLIIKKGKRG